MEDLTEQGDCCPISQDGIEAKGISFGSRLVRPDGFDSYVDKESARARSRMLGCIGIRQYGSTNGGTVWMPCSNESDYRRVTGQGELSRRQRRRMLKIVLSDETETKALGSAIGRVGGVRDMNPATARDADLDGLVLEGLPQINMGRGIPDPTPGSDFGELFGVPEKNSTAAEITARGPEMLNRRNRNPIQKPAKDTSEETSVEVAEQVLPRESEKANLLEDLILRLRESTGINYKKRKKLRKNPKAFIEEDLVTRNRMDLIGVPTGILDVFDSSSIYSPTDFDGRNARLITSGGTNGNNSLNAAFLYDVMRNQSSLRSFVSPLDSQYSAQLAALVREGRLPKLAKVILEMSPESVEDFLAVNPRVMINAAQSAKKKLRPNGSWMAKIDNDPFETVAHLLRAKDYHISAIANGSDSQELSEAIDELVGSNASETSAIFSSLVAVNKQRLSDAYDGSPTVAKSGTRLLSAARDLLVNATENDSIWRSSREAIFNVSEAMSSGGDVSAGMAGPVVRYGSNYPRHRRKTGDWSPIANKIRDSVQRYKNRYGAPAANSADLARFVDFSYPELLDEAAELIDLMKQKIEYGSLKIDDYASEGWLDRDRAELALDEFDPLNLESIFDPGKRMGLLKAIGITLVAAAKAAPSRMEREGVMDLYSEVNEWGFTVLPLYSEPKAISSRKREIFPAISYDANAGMKPSDGSPRDVRQVLASSSEPIDARATIRLRKKLMEKANDLLAKPSEKDLIARLAGNKQGPVAEISETFLSEAEKYDWDQGTLASAYEDLTEMMERLVGEVPNKKDRDRLASMFTEALEDIAENLDEENVDFFSRAGDIPSRTVSRLARRIISDDADAGMALDPYDRAMKLVDDIEPTREQIDAARLDLLQYEERMGNLPLAIGKASAPVRRMEVNLVDLITKRRPMAQREEILRNIAEWKAVQEALRELIDETSEAFVKAFGTADPDFSRMSPEQRKNYLDIVKYRVSGGSEVLDDPSEYADATSRLGPAGSRGVLAVPPTPPDSSSVAPTSPRPTARRLSDADTSTIYDGVMRVVGSLDNENIVKHPNNADSWREKMRAAGIAIPFSSDEFLDELADSTLPTQTNTPRPIFQDPLAGVSEDAVEYLDDLLNVVINEIGAPTTGTTEQFVSELKRLTGITDSSDFHDLIRSLSTRYGRSTNVDFAEQVMENNYLTTSAIKNRITDRFPDFYEIIDSPNTGDAGDAGMIGPVSDRIRAKVLESRQIRELGKLAQIDEQKDYRMRTTEARRRRLLSMASPGSFLDFLTKGVTNQRSRLYIRRIATRMGGLYGYLSQSSEGEINAIFEELYNFVSSAKANMIAGGNASPYSILRQAAQITAIEEDPDFRPYDTGKFTDEELLQKIDANSWESLLPEIEDLLITPSDIDAVPSFRAKAEAALEVMALDRTQLIELLAGETTQQEALNEISSSLQSQIRGVGPDRAEFVPTPAHVEQLMLAEAISPLEPESYLVFVQSLDDAQLDTLSREDAFNSRILDLAKTESKTISFATAARKLFAIRQLVSTEPTELEFFEEKARSLLADPEFSPLIKDLISALLADDESPVSSILSKIFSSNAAVTGEKIFEDENYVPNLAFEEKSLLRAMYELGRNSKGIVVSSLLPPSIEEAGKLATARSTAVAVLKSQTDGGRKMARNIIDSLPKGGKGYELVRTVSKPGDPRKYLGLQEAIKNYDGSTESALRIIYSLSESQLNRLRNNYLIPVILQKMDRKAYEARQEQSSIAQTRARIDNLGRRLEMLTFGTDDSSVKIEDVVSRVDEALANAFGDRMTDISRLLPEERTQYADIVDYYISGGLEVFEDPSEYAKASRRLRFEKAETPLIDATSPSSVPPPSSVTPEPEKNPASGSDEDFWGEMGIDQNDGDGNAGMSPQPPPTPPTPPDPSQKTFLAPLPEATARKLFGEEIYEYVKSRRFTEESTFPITAISEEATYARKAIESLYSLARGNSPENVSERLRSEGSYAAYQLVFGALSRATLLQIKNMPDSPYDFPDESVKKYDPRADDNKDRRNFFLAAMQEYLSIHMALGSEMLPIVDEQSGRDPYRYSFEIFRDDFQLQMSQDLKSFRLVYNPDSANDKIRQDPFEPSADEFMGDPSEHPDVQIIDGAISTLRRQFPEFRDWQNQANRYSRILGGAHYEKRSDKFGIGIIDQVLADPSSMDLDKVIRQIADQFYIRGNSDSSRLAQDAESLGPDPDDVSPFPNLESYPDPEKMIGSDVPSDTVAKHKKIAVSSAKSSAAARQSWWNMFTTGTTMDMYEIAAVSKTTDGDNFHPKAILAGLRKFARDNSISDSQFDSFYSVAENAASGRYNSVALQKTIAALNDIAMNSRGGLNGELKRLDNLLHHIEQQNKELSRHYQDRLRARIQTVYAAWGVIYSSFQAERERLAEQLALGKLTPIEVVDETRRLWLTLQPVMRSALNQLADLNRRAEASQRARNALEIQKNEVETRIEEIRKAAKLTGQDADGRMGIIRSVNNALSHLSEDSSGLSDDADAGMSLGNLKFGIVGTRRDPVAPRRDLLSSAEKKFSAEITQIVDLLSRINLESMDKIPDIRTAMATLRGGKPDRVVPQMRFGTPEELDKAKSVAALMIRADADAEAATRKIMGARFKRFSDFAISSLPGLTKRIVEDATIDGFVEAMQANAVKEADLDAALVMYSQAIQNAKNFSIFNPVAVTAQMFKVEPEEISDAIATESLLSKTSNLLRMAQSYVSGLSGAYGEASIRRMTLNRFPELRNFGPVFVDSIFSSPLSFEDAMRKLNSAISMNNLVRINPRAISAGFGVSEDVAQLISASAPPRKPLTELRSQLPFEWNFMTFRDRQSWLSSEEAFNSLGRMSVNDELSKLQRQIEDFGSMDGPYPALARLISGNDTSTGAFGRQLITSDGRSPMYLSRGFQRSDLVRNGQNQISQLISAVPGIAEMSDRALSRFLGATYDTIAELRREGFGVSQESSERLARAFGKTASEVWSVVAPISNADPGNFYWLASTWDRSGEVLAAFNEGSDPYAVASEIRNGTAIADKLSELLNDGTVNRFYDQLGLESISIEDAREYASSVAPRSRKGVVEILAASGFKEAEIIDATGFNPNTVRNSLFELRKQGLLPEVIGSPKWISRNGPSVLSDFYSGMSKRALMKKYEIGSKTLDSILASSDGASKMDNAYDDASAGMANRRLPEDARMADGPSPDWRSERQRKADGSEINPELQSPPAVVADPFVETGTPAAMGLDGATKDAEQMSLWGQAISSWTALVLEGGYFRNLSAGMTPGEMLLSGIFGSNQSFEETEINLTPNFFDGSIIRGGKFNSFEIAVRQDNPENEILALAAIPSVMRSEFSGTGIYRGINPMLRTMILATYDKYFNGLQVRDTDDDGAFGVSTEELIEAGILDDPELPQNENDQMRLKLWQLRQILRNPNSVDAPPMFELGDEKVMRLLIPIMASADEKNMIRSKFGAIPVGLLGEPSESITQRPSVDGATFFEVENFLGQSSLAGVPMFSNLLLGSALSGNLEARKLVDELTPRQIMLSNWVYGIYTAVEPIVNAFGEMLPVKTNITPSPNIPDEPGSEMMLGDKKYETTSEVDDQVFAFAFDSLFKSLQNMAEQPGLVLMEALPTDAWSSLYAPSNEDSTRKANDLIKSTQILARITADVLATAIYRKAVQSLAKAADDQASPFYVGPDDSSWLSLARPRVDSYGYWSMYGPNIVYAGSNMDPYIPGWNDESNPITELATIAPNLSIERRQEEKQLMQDLQRLIDETPGKYWWETEAAYGQLDDDQILEMHPEEFADYVSSMAMFEDGELEEERSSQMLTRLMGRISSLGYPNVELERFDEWIGPIIKALPEGTVTKESVLQQLKNIFPWLELDRMDDIYPVVGKNFSEAMQVMKDSLELLSQEQINAIARRRPQLSSAINVLFAGNSPASASPLAQYRSQFVLPIIKGVLEMHRSNMELGYRQVATFSTALRKLTESYEIGNFEREITAINGLMNELREKGLINPITYAKLQIEIARTAGAGMFEDLEYGGPLLDALASGGQEEIFNFIEITRQNMEAGGRGLDAPEPTEAQRNFIENWSTNLDAVREQMGDIFEEYIRGGLYGSVKTIGEAVREMEPFIVATERSRRRRSLLPRYKREVIDPIKDSLLSDEDRMTSVPTFNEWMDANGFKDLTTDKNEDGGDINAGMSALTRTVMARFTDDAVSAIVEGYEDAAQSQSSRMNVGHILSGAWRSLMTDVNNPGAYLRSLRQMGITVEAMTNALSEITTPTDGSSPRPTGFSKAAQSTIIGAIKAAAARGDEFVDLGDLLQSIFDDNMRGGNSDGVMEALDKAKINTNRMRLAIASARIDGGATFPLEADSGMNSGRSTMNLIDKRDDLMRSKILANGLWFNANRPESIVTGTATDGELVDELERLIDLYSGAAPLGELEPKDFRGGESPFSNNAVRMTNSYLIHGSNGQEPNDLLGSIRHAMDRADALLTDDGEQRRLSELKSKIRLYFDNDEHMPDDTTDANAGMTRNFSEMIEPIADTFARNETTDQKRYFEGIYGDADLSEGELRKVSDNVAIGTPFDISRNLEGNEDDVSWSTSQWSFNKDETYVEAADSVMIRMKDGDISTAEIAMISRKSGPFRDALALVGGLRDEGEDFMTTAARETQEEVGVSLENALQAKYIGTIEAPDWDTRFVNGAKVGAGMFVLPWDTQLVAASDASGARWVPLSEIASGQNRIAFGHAEWIRRAVAAMNIDPSSDPYGDLRLSIAQRLGLLSKAARVRNQKMIAQVNLIRRTTGNKLFPETSDMPHPMMPWGNRVAKFSWKFGDNDANAGMSSNFIDDSLPRSLGLMSVQSSMPASLLEQGADTSGIYRVGHSRGGPDLFSAWDQRDKNAKDRVDQLWRPYVEKSIEIAKRGDVPNDMEKPVVYILGGASGTGKSTARSTGLFGIPNYESAVVSDPDDAKIMMPEARLWYSRRLKEASGLVHQESRQVAAVMARAATKEGLNLVYDTSGQFNDGFGDLRDWKKLGYDLVAHYFFAPESTLLRRVREREERTGRGVPASIVKTIQWNVSQMLPNFMARQMFDELYIWDSEKDPVKPLLIGQFMMDKMGQPQVLQVKHPYLFRYLFVDRIGPDGDTLEPRKTEAITIPYGKI